MCLFSNNSKDEAYAVAVKYPLLSNGLVEYVADRRQWDVSVTCLQAPLLVMKQFSVPDRFGEESMNRLIRWMQKYKIPLDASVLDIGTGNGALLVELVGTLRILVLQPDFKMKFRTLAIEDTSHLN